MRRPPLWCVALAAGWLGACADDEPAAGTGGAQDATAADTTGGSDTAGPDAGADAAQDGAGGADTAGDGGVLDGGPTDSGGPGGTDTVADAGADAGADGGSDAGADGGADASSPACGAGSPAALAACVDQSNYEELVLALEGARPTGTPAWQAAQDLCATRLEEYGFTVTRHNYGGGENVIGVLPGTTQPDMHVVIGAHHDGTPLCAGADDNATGVAGALEAARVLATTDHARTLVVACWDEEERGLYGSFAWAREANESGKRIVVNFTLEMIGYFTSEPNTQEFPPGFGALYPDLEQAMVDNEWRGDFIGLITRTDAAPYVEAFIAQSEGSGLPAYQVALEPGLAASPLVGDLRRSDHAPFWAYDYPAIQITDTSEFRYKAYHCGQGEDTSANLDHATAAKVVGATVASATLALAEGPADEGSAGTPSACDPIAQGCGDGQRCALTLSNIGIWAVECIAEAEEPRDQRYEVCERPTNQVGVDTCDKGLWCTLWGVPLGTEGRQCLGMCKGDADCLPDERCMRPGATQSPSGVCMKACDPFGDVCGEGLACHGEWRAFEGGHPAYVCDKAGAKGEGQSCKEANYECQDGLSCTASPIDGLFRCQPHCDAAHACAAGAVCNPPVTQPEGSTTGTCWGTE